MSTIDLNNPPDGHKFSVKVDPEEKDADRYVRLFKDVVVFLVAVGLVGVIGLLCYNTVTSATATAEEKKWAMAIISGAAGGVLGYLLRR